MKRLFTSESVGEGHPDKIADQISDALLDALIHQDKTCRTGIETMVTTGLVILSGEVSTTAHIDYLKVVRKTIEHIGYTSSNKYFFNSSSCGIINTIHHQSPDIAIGVNRGGAGDQGIMFGYAINETEEYMPLTILLAHKLLKRLSYIRKKTSFMPYLGPDCKSQITIEYENQKIKRIHTILISTQHTEDVEQSQIKEDLIKYVIEDVIDSAWLDKDTLIYVNPTGKFIIGGPHGDAGLTGRKIIVDTYGGHGATGGGAFSGKDPTKVDRSGSYAARHIAKNIVASGLAKKCLVQLSYGIGIAEPLSTFIDTYNTGIIADNEIEKIVSKCFDCTPQGIINRFDLLKPIYTKTASYGHFGYIEYPWEKLDYVEKLRKTI